MFMVKLRVKLVSVDLWSNWFLYDGKISLQTFTCSKSTIEALEKKKLSMFKVNQKTSERV